MSSSPEQLALFGLFVGGRHAHATIELHDVQFVIARRLEETFPLLRSRWWGVPSSLHLDAYVKLECVDGFLVTPVPIDKAEQRDLSLYFVNTGGYAEGVFGEMHSYSFHVHRDKRAVWAEAKSRATAFGQLHQDDFDVVDDIVCVDDQIATQRYALAFRPADERVEGARIVAKYMKMDAVADSR